MTTRQTTTAPQLPEYDYISRIGSGGYADVYLYEAHSPRRQVAIKVLHAEALERGSVADYTEEANVMAMVSAHPYIVQVFRADVSPDGRPYLVMEYYPHGNFQERARREHLAVDEVLRVGIQVACAVEVAHRSNILHRDIKPANILLGEYDRPGLTDFGIAAVEGPDGGSTDDGLSIPWSPPEALGEAPNDRRSDVYSLAATLYTLLAGRSPFEQPGGDNRPLALMTRIERDPVPPIQRADVPKTLERVLAGAMAKDPAARPATAEALAHQLREVESGEGWAVTRLELPNMGTPSRARSETPDDDATRIKSITTVDAQELRAKEPAPSAKPVAPLIDAADRVPSADYEPAARDRQGMLGAPAVDATIARPTAQQSQSLREQVESLPERAERRFPVLWVAVAAVSFVVVAAVVGVRLLGSEASSPASNAEEEQAQINDNFGDDNGAPVAVAPSPIPEITVTTEGTDMNEFTWSASGTDVVYAVTVEDTGFTDEIDEPIYRSTSSCIEVAVIAPSGLMSAPTRGCAP